MRHGKLVGQDGMKFLSASLHASQIKSKILLTHLAAFRNLKTSLSLLVIVV